ncbi:hypothetical protein AB0E08_23240 [Streptomyces sp. NPDC048281]|uniref:hypothetical protein n=1 Tax=Streptomyces sp. NPDC048281 TaxID=3154715 RepID=UPI003437EE8F
MMPAITAAVENEVNRSQQQLEKLFGQLQKLLEQREKSLTRRKEWTELPPEASPEEHLRRLQVLSSERGRQPGMQKLADKLSGLGDQLLKRLTPTGAQIEMRRTLESQLQEVGRLEQLQQQREDLMEQPLREVLTEVAQAHPPTVLQQRMLQAAGNVQQLTSEMQQLRSVSAPVPVPPAQAAGSNVTKQELPQMPVLRYEQVRIAAGHDKTTQNEAVAMARDLGHDPSRLANAIQGCSNLGSADFAAAASLRSPGVEGKKSPTAAPVPQASTSANAAKSPPSKAINNRRSR